MGNYLVQRLATIIPTLFFVSILIFGLQQLLPGDPAIILAGEDRDPSVVAHLHEKLHLDDPLPVRYLYWAGGVLKVRTPDGILILENLPEEAEVVVDDKRVTLKPKGGTTFEISVALGLGVGEGLEDEFEEVDDDELEDPHALTIRPATTSRAITVLVDTVLIAAAILTSGP